MRSNFLLLITAFGVLSSISRAQVSDSVPEEMKLIQGLVGEWTGTVKMTPPGSKTSMEMKSTVVVKSYGPYQESVYTMEMPGMKFTGHTFTTYDSPSQSFKAWTFDDNVNVPRTETGSWTGKKLVMVSEPHGGMVTRTTFEPMSKDTIKFTIELKNGDDFDPLGECLYKRKA